MKRDSIAQFVHPNSLKRGDKIRFVSPASTPNRNAVEKAANLLRGWGYEVDFGRYAFNELNYLAGTDAQRLDDLNTAFGDPAVRAIFATRGGKGSYRIADRIDFGAAGKDPKFLVGFSDITAILLSLAKRGIGGGIHGAVFIEEGTPLSNLNGMPLKEMLTGSDDVILKADANVETLNVTTKGRATGTMVGGNLDMVATTAGWALPDLNDKILLLEAVNMHLGHVDRQLSMLTKAGHLDGISGIALGQFTGFDAHGSLTISDLLREHLEPLGVPILGGLPLGHGPNAKCVPLCFPTELNCEAGKLTVKRRVAP